MPVSPDNRQIMIQRAQAVVQRAVDAGRDLSLDELNTVRRLREAADEAGALEQRSARVADDRAKFFGAGPGIEVTRNEGVYRPEGGEYSFIRDVVASTRGDYGALERLHRHQAAVDDRERRDGTSTGATSMGSYIPPVWLVERIAPAARVGRVIAPLATSGGEPTSTSITIPRITTGATVAGQAGDNAAVSETDQITAQLTRTTVTIAGQQDVALQALDLGLPGVVDRLIFADLEGAYQAELDRQILRGSGTNELLGINQVASIIAVSYTDGTPTVPEFYPKLADAIQQIHTNRFAPPDSVLMHPRRWAWIVAALDTQNRPLVVPSTAAANGIAAFSSPNAQGAVGEIAGVPIYTTASVATNLGAGTEDQLVVARMSDTVLMEGRIRTRVLAETLSGTLTVRLQLWAYVSFFGGRFPKSIATIGGTGCIAPTF